MEALAAGVPVVAMAVDGVAEVVRDGENGFLVAEGDVAALVARVAAILGDPELRERLAGAADRGLGEFERDTMVRQQEGLYRELARGRESGDGDARRGEADAPVVVSARGTERGEHG